VLKGNVGEKLRSTMDTLKKNLRLKATLQFLLGLLFFVLWALFSHVDPIVCFLLVWIIFHFSPKRHVDKLMEKNVVPWDIPEKTEDSWLDRLGFSKYFVVGVIVTVFIALFFTLEYLYEIYLSQNIRFVIYQYAIALIGGCWVTGIYYLQLRDIGRGTFRGMNKLLPYIEPKKDI
jgi:hypothetical protein